LATEEHQLNNEAAKIARSFPWYFRVPLKWLAFGVVTFFVLFPSPTQFARHVSRLRNLQAMIEPDAPELAVFEEEIRQRLQGKGEGVTTGPAIISGEGAAPVGDSQPAGWPRDNARVPTATQASASRDALIKRWPAKVVQAAVERLVLDKVKYAWDWDTW
jgi:hypothetical protein